MITKLQNSVVMPQSIAQPEVESFDASKNEVSIETLELTERKKDTSGQKRSSLVMERKFQADLHAAQLHREVDESGTEKNMILPYLEQDNS
ncbi:phage tail protein [bacterium]|nr:phage tail protein [bacterium]